MVPCHPCPDDARLKQFLLGHSPPGEAGPLEQHLLGCTACQAAAESAHALDTLSAALARPPAPAEWADEPAVARLVGRLQHLALSATNLLPAAEGLVPPGLLGPPERPGEVGRLGRFRVLRLLGAGGMGLVFEAEDEALRRRVALKVMRPELAASAAGRERFRLETQAAAALEHDHVVPIYHVGEAAGPAGWPVPFLVMPLLRGEPLDARVKRLGRLPTAEVLRIGREAAAGLAAAHRAGLVHRDVKPANLWLEEGSDRVKVLDFGLARGPAGGGGLTLPGTVLGTPAYLAPEQASGGAVDARADLFSLGCVLYLLSTGRPPFQGDNPLAVLWAIGAEAPTPPHEACPKVPRALSALLLRLLAKAPAGRPASAEVVEQELLAIEQAIARPRRRRLVRLAVALAASAALVVGGVLAFGVRQKGRAPSNEPDLGQDVGEPRPIPSPPAGPGPVPAPVLPPPPLAKETRMVVGNVRVAPLNAGMPWRPDLYVRLTRDDPALKERLAKLEEEAEGLRGRDRWQKMIGMSEQRLAKMDKADPFFELTERNLERIRTSYPPLKAEERRRLEEIDRARQGLARRLSFQTAVAKAVEHDFGEGDLIVAEGDKVEVHVMDKYLFQADDTLATYRVVVTADLLRKGELALGPSGRALAVALKFRTAP